MKGYVSDYYRIDYMSGVEEFAEVMECCRFYIRTDWQEPWFERIRLCGQTITLQRSTNPILCQGVGEDRPEWEQLEYKIVGWRELPLDLHDCIPTIEPDLCIFVFSYIDDLGDDQLELELYVRRDYLDSSQGKRLSTATKIARLRTDFAYAKDDDD
jgi:hypothetical protein